MALNNMKNLSFVGVVAATLLAGACLVVDADATLTYRG